MKIEKDHFIDFFKEDKDKNFFEYIMMKDFYLHNQSIEIKFLIK